MVMLVPLRLASSATLMPLDAISCLGPGRSSRNRSMAACESVNMLNTGIYTADYIFQHAFSTLTLFGPKYSYGIHKQRLPLVMLPGLFPPE